MYRYQIVLRIQRMKHSFMILILCIPERIVLYMAFEVQLDYNKECTRFLEPL